MNADYAASKHGVIGLTKALALELGLLGFPGITANAICPGNTATPMMDAITERVRPFFKDDTTEEIQAKITSKSIQKRMLDPVEIAHMAVYLASDEAKGITGQAMNVCVGMVLW